MNTALGDRTSVVATGASLSAGAAIWDALCWRDADFYPRIAEGGGVSTLDTSATLQEMERASALWTNLQDNEALKSALDLAKQSLAEVKAQTEYQDQKATRLLTVTAFLSALSGALFAQFEDAYPVATLLRQSSGVAFALGLGYATFAAFVILSLSGALVTFHAIRTRFKYPSTQNTDDQEKDPRSLLFYQPLIRSRPWAWINGWVTVGVDGDAREKTALRDDLRQRYFRNVVSETYLVAAKTADKVRYLEPAQGLLASSLRCLFLWLLLLGAISILVPSTKAPARPVEVTFVSTPPSLQPHSITSAKRTRSSPERSSGYSATKNSNRALVTGPVRGTKGSGP